MNYYCFLNINSEIFFLMPSGFPIIDNNTRYADVKRKAEVMLMWYKKHKHRLAWNPDTRKYFLKPESD